MTRTDAVAHVRDTLKGQEIVARLNGREVPGFVILEREAAITLLEHSASARELRDLPMRETSGTEGASPSENGLEFRPAPTPDRLAALKAAEGNDSPTHVVSTREAVRVLLDAAAVQGAVSGRVGNSPSPSTDRPALQPLSPQPDELRECVLHVPPFLAMRLAAEHPEAVAPRTFEYRRKGWPHAEATAPCLHWLDTLGQVRVTVLEDTRGDKPGRCRTCEGRSYLGDACVCKGTREGDPAYLLAGMTFLESQPGATSWYWRLAMLERAQ